MAVRGGQGPTEAPKHHPLGSFTQAAEKGDGSKRCRIGWLGDRVDGGSFPLFREFAHGPGVI